MTELVIGDLRTGRRLISLPYTRLSWEKGQNEAEKIRVSIPINARLVKKLDLRNITTPAKTFIAVIENDVVVAAGIVWRRTHTKGTGSLELSASGLWSYFDHRHILPVLTDSQNIIDPESGESGAWANTDFAGFSYGTIAKKWVQQSRAWTGGNLPIVFQSDEAGTYTKPIIGANLTVLGEALRQLTALKSGIDIDFFARRTSDRLGIEWVMRTGTISQPELHGLGVHRWDYSVSKPSIQNLQEVNDATSMTGQAWTTGGRQDGSALVERATNPTLVAAGYPLLESLDSSHSDVSEPSTLIDYSALAIAVGRAPLNAWTFEVKANESPFVGAYWPGDYCDIVIGDDPWFPKGTHRREIASISGDGEGKWIQVTTLEVIDG